MLAKEAGLLYTTVAIVTDYDCWREEGEHVTHSNVLKAFQQNIHKVIDLIVHAVTNIGSGDWEDEIKKARVSVSCSLLCFLGSFLFKSVACFGRPRVSRTKELNFITVCC